nr:hypothetical protein [Nitrosomonas nitrosa]
MAHSLYRPHVLGPQNNITTPDIIVDRVSLLADGERAFIPVHRLGSHVEFQVFPGELVVTPAYAIVAAGGGALLSVAALVRCSGEPIARAELLIARSAWRLRNIVDGFGSLQLSVWSGMRTEIIALSQLLQPDEIMSHADGGELALPRGVIALCAAQHASTIAAAPAEVFIRLVEPTMGRELVHRTKLVSVNADPWDRRPLPRYTVGPVGDVQHYI